MAKRRQRRTQRLPSLDDLWGGGYTGNLMRGEYSHRADVLAALQRRHEKGVAYIDSEGYWSQGGRRWLVPYGVRAAFREQLTFSQVASKYPFYVQWQHPSTNGKAPRTLTRQCTTLGVACSFIATHLTGVDPSAFIVVKNGFYIPSTLMGKFPRHLKDGKFYYWCPRCMQPRTFRRRRPDESFYVNKKYPITDKYGNQHYEWKNVKLAVLECSHCGISNRDNKFRASNQPVEKVKVRATRRARRRR